MNTVNSPKQKTHRQRQAEATRAMIVAAARRLFGAHGYAVTSMEAIAAGAGVAPRTVYNAFGTKGALLAAVCEAWLEEADIKPLVGQALEARDPVVKLRLAAQWTRQQYERGADVIGIFESAARDDLEMARTVGEWLAAKNELMGRVVASMASALHRDLAVEDATTIFLGLTSFDLYRQMVLDSGWSPDRYQSWLEGALRRELLAAPAAP